MIDDGTNPYFKPWERRVLFVVWLLAAIKFVKIVKFLVLHSSELLK